MKVLYFGEEQSLPHHRHLQHVTHHLKPALSQRTKFIVYLIFIHLVFGVGAFVLIPPPRWHLLWVEGFFGVSFLISLYLVRSLKQPLAFIDTGTDLMRESDYTSRFRETGNRELDRLVGIYNYMVDHLRDERTRMQELNIFLEKVMRASPSGILTCDFDNQITMANQSAEYVLGRSEDDLVGLLLSDLKPPFGKALSQLDVGESVVLPFQGRRRVKCQKAQFLDRSFPRTFITLEELTEELRQSEKSAYEQLIRMMSHEINNTTGAVMSLLHSSLHYKTQLTDDDQTDFELAMRVAMERTDHLNAFMRSFADVVRLPEPHLQPHDIQQILADLEVAFQAECAERCIAWVWDIETPLPLILLDAHQMERALVNILRNAMEAIEANGTITLHLNGTANPPSLTIEDTGGALSNDVAIQLFKPFFSTKPNGHGIGLTLVQEILHRHHFDFTLEGDPGSITRFTIWFTASQMRLSALSGDDVT